MNIYIDLCLLTISLQIIEATLFEKLKDMEEEELRYQELINATASLVNENTKFLKSPYVATIGARSHVSDRILKDINSVRATPANRHSLTRSVIVFADLVDNLTTMILKNINLIHRRGRYVVCITSRHLSKEKLIKKYTRPMLDLWANRITQVILIALTDFKVSYFGIDPYHENACFPRSLIYLGNSIKGQTLTRLPFFRKINNLNGCPLRIATTNEMPYVEIYVENNVTKVRGAEGNLMNVLSDRMNFTAHIVDSRKVPGLNLADGDIKQLLYQNLSDVCFGAKKVSVTDVECSVSLMDCEKVWIVPKSQPIAAWKHVFKPFQQSVWIPLAIVMILGLMMCRLITDDRLADLLKLWAFFLGNSVDTAQSPEKMSTKVFLTTWLIFSYVVTQVYLGSMESFLTMPKFEPEIDTYEQLIASNIRLQGQQVVMQFFCSENDTISKIICKRYKFRSFNSIYEEIWKKGTIEMAFVLKSDSSKISDFLKKYDHHVMKEVLLKYTTAFFVQPGAPFFDEMNRIIFSLGEAGFINLWMRQNTLIKCNQKLYPKTLQMKHISGIVFIALVGYAIATITFFVEYFINSVYFPSSTTLGRKD